MFSRRRILVVIDSMEVAGSQRQVQKLIEGLDREQWDPELAFFRVDSFLAEALRQSGITVHHVPKRRRFDPRFLQAYARLLRERRYALVHAFSLTAELWTIAARRLARVNPVLVASERSSGRTDRTFLYWQAKRLVVASSAAVIANSEAGARSTATLTAVPVDKFTTIANAVDLPLPISDSMREAVRDAFGLVDGQLLGLFVGRLVPVKNLPCLVRALAGLEPGRRPLMLLAGEGPLMHPLMELAGQCGLEASFRCLGERRDVAQLMQSADFLVLPSRSEGQSNAVLEAMAAGCPVIASAVGGSVEVIKNGVSGLLFPDDDSDALAGCIDAIHDKGLRTRLAKEAKRIAEQKFSQSNLALETAAVYQRCLEGVAPEHWPIGRASQMTDPPVEMDRQDHSTMS